jgi:hypothetical protein
MVDVATERYGTWYRRRDHELRSEARKRTSLDVADVWFCLRLLGELTSES